MLLFLTGLASGIITGMGIGGGTILIPALALVSSLTQQQLQGVNLVVFLPAALAALVIHRKKGSVDTGQAKPLILFGLIGAAAGAFLALRLDPSLLRKFFALFLLLIGCFELFRKPNAKSKGPKS